ncbi:MAG: gamma-glutamylcyclotransferase [Proteobacteria bacterium]|nr:gamma-glutamylcyclotransferase [Pseudomonadota bacterium]
MADVLPSLQSASTTEPSPYAAIAVRDPAVLFEEMLAAWGGHDDVWVFGYASLIWRPEFAAVEQRPAIVHGWHRALEMRSRVNRGTPECPGLVFALVRGGSCRGIAYRIDSAHALPELKRLWAREMPTGVYDAKWLRCGTAPGRIRALAFTLANDSPAYTGTIGDDEMVAVLRTAHGRYGTTLDYLVDTARGLRDHAIHDREIERLMALVQRHALC